MKIHDNLKIIDLALKYKDNLIISDLHIGLEEALNKAGLLVPRFQLQEVLARLEKIFSKAKNAKQVIINGDLKHEFGEISNQEWRDTLRVLDFITAHDLDVVLIKGNHDTILGPIAKKRNIKIVDFFNIDKITILHGDKILDLPKSKSKSKVMIIGHEHPCISFKPRRDEKFKCFLKGKARGKTIIVMPSFCLVNEGYDIMQEKPISPYIEKVGLDDFEVYVVEPETKEKVLHFGKLKNIKNLN